MSNFYQVYQDYQAKKYRNDPGYVPPPPASSIPQFLELHALTQRKQCGSRTPGPGRWQPRDPERQNQDNLLLGHGRITRNPIRRRSHNWGLDHRKRAGEVRLPRHGPIAAGRERLPRARPGRATRALHAHSVEENGRDQGVQPQAVLVPWRPHQHRWWIR